MRPLNRSRQRGHCLVGMALLVPCMILLLLGLLQLPGWFGPAALRPHF